jgi:hypothetical protein
MYCDISKLRDGGSRNDHGWGGEKVGLGLLGHDHLFAFSEALPYEAHLIVEALHSVLTAAHILRVFVVDELRFTVFADEHPALVIRDSVRVEGGVRPVAQWAYIAFVVELLGHFGWVGGRQRDRADMGLTLRKPVSITRCISATLHLMTLQNRL